MIRQNARGARVPDENAIHLLIRSWLLSGVFNSCKLIVSSLHYESGMKNKVGPAGLSYRRSIGCEIESESPTLYQTGI